MKKYILLGIMFLLTFASSVTLFAGGGENSDNGEIQLQQIAAMDKFYQEIHSPRFLKATAATNPPYAEINQAINDLSSKCKIPAIIIKAMVYQESSWRQFDDTGAPLISPDNGIGLTQVTVSNPNNNFETKTLGSIVPGIQGDNPFAIETSQTAVDINLLKTDWRYNLEIGCRILLAKKVASVSEGDDATLLENWWYTLAYYNGLAAGGANDPANPIYTRAVSENWHWLSISRFPYQECVFNIVAQLYTLPTDLAPYFGPRFKVTLPGPVAVNIGAGNYDYVDASFSGGKSITYYKDNRAVVNGQIFNNVIVHWVELEPAGVPEAKSGFQRPMVNDHSGYTFNEWSDVSGCYHPGWDYNGPGGCDDDRGTDIWAVANGLVVDVNTTDWGNIVIEHLYKGITVYSQYGHLDSVLVSEGQIVSKGQHIGELGDRGTDCAHLHWEIRESDHPDPRNAAYWNKSAFQSQATIENWYEDPQWWVDNHGPYQPSGFAAVSEGVTVTPSPVFENEKYTVTFTLKEINGAPITFAEIAVLIQDASGSDLFYLDEHYYDVTIPANGTWTYNGHGWAVGKLCTPGTYKAWARGKVDNWFNFTTTGSGVNPGTFQVIPFYADFVGTPTSGCASLTVQFTDKSTGTAGAPTSWSWSFGDGGTSSQQNPSHTYTSAGTYTVSLTVSNQCGNDTETKTNYITVQPKPNADFVGAPTSGCVSLNVQFTDKSTGNPTSWSWNFGDGGTSSQQNPSHTYTSTGAYTVSLTVSNQCGNDTETKTNYIAVLPKPSADFVGNPTKGDAPLTVQFTDKSTGNPTSWSWSFGDGGASTQRNPSYTYTNPGKYKVSLTAANDCGPDTETKTDYIEVTKPAQPPIANFEGNPTSGCASLTVQFTDKSTGSPTSWSWTFGDGGTSTVQNPSHTYTNPGKYTVSLTASNQFGSDTETKTDYITALPKPNADFVANPTSGYAPLTVQFTDNSTGNPTSWSWSFGDGGTSTQKNPSHTYINPGTYTVSLTATNDCGPDTETKSNYIEVKPPKEADFTWSPESPKEGESVQFTDLSTPQQGITSWSWNFGDGGTSSAQNPKHIYQQAGNPSQTFNVSLTVYWSSDSDIETKSIVVSDKDPAADFTFAPQNPVAGQEVQFTDQSTSYDGITSWLWEFGDGKTSNERNPKHKYAQGKIYTVSLTVSEADGDTNTAHKDITVYHQYGDVSLDGRVTGYDAALVLQHTVQIFTLNEEQQKIADVDCNGEITAWDASLILRYAVGKITEFPCQTGQPPAIADLFLPLHFIQGQGQANYNIALSLPALSVKPNELFFLPIQIKQDTNVVSACELTLNYETGVLTPTRVITTETTKEYTLEYQIKDGKIKISLAGAEAITKSGAFVRVEFKPQIQPMISRLSLENVRLNGKIFTSISQGIVEVLPQKSALLQNFPNPFNPETWIPYQLKEEAEVVIQIYNIKGELIRTLSIGHKPAGSYLSREKAVFWNGKNQNGEDVANGLYFYTLKAGEFQAARKMILVK